MHPIARCLQESLILTIMIIHCRWSDSNKNFEFIMNYKTSPFAIQDKKLRDIDLSEEYPLLGIYEWAGIINWLSGLLE